MTIGDFDPSAKPVPLTTYIDDEDVFRVMSAGAKGYLLKDKETDMLMACICRGTVGGKHILMQVADQCGSPINAATACPVSN